MELSVSELINLVIAVAVLPLVVAIWRKSRALQGAPALLIGYFLMVASYTLTILEGVGGAAGELLNLAEHVALLCAGVAFVIGVRALARQVGGERS
ncbi:MAG: hypothetical protein U1E26_10945 [Coriobacteriia bacterium]|nr:hypothetical protein [Coriobacteriia bacterium]